MDPDRILFKALRFAAAQAVAVFAGILFLDYVRAKSPDWIPYLLVCAMFFVGSFAVRAVQLRRQNASNQK